MFNGLCHLGTAGSAASVGTWALPAGLGPWGWLGMISSLVLWIGMIGGVMLLVVWAVRRGQSQAAQRTPAQLLQVQYARGEITREQYELRKHDVG